MYWKLKAFCIKHNYFTGGTNSQYQKLFDQAENGASVKELAQMIHFCSPDTLVETIEEQLQLEVFNI